MKSNKSFSESRTSVRSCSDMRDDTQLKNSRTYTGASAVCGMYWRQLLLYFSRRAAHWGTHLQFKIIIFKFHQIKFNLYNSCIITLFFLKQVKDRCWFKVSNSLVDQFLSCGLALPPDKCLEVWGDEGEAGRRKFTDIDKSQGWVSKTKKHKNLLFILLRNTNRESSSCKSMISLKNWIKKNKTNKKNRGGINCKKILNSSWQIFFPSPF